MTIVQSVTADLVDTTMPTAAPCAIRISDLRERRRMARRKHLAILLEVDCRRSLTDLSRELRVPISTLFDDIAALRESHAFILLPKSTAGPPALDTLPAGWQRITQHRLDRQQRIVAALREDARLTATKLSRRLGIPVSTLAEDLAAVRQRFVFTIEAKAASIPAPSARN